MSFLVINIVPNIYSFCLKLILLKKYLHIRINNWLAEKRPQYFKKMTKKKAKEEIYLE